MADRTGIEWTDATWNPVTGCTEVSPGCDHCYAKTFAERWRGVPGHHFERGFDVQLRPERLEQPLRWRRPRRIFVNSMSDLFHDAVPDTYIARVFAVMTATRWRHTYQILTKRHARMRYLLNNDWWANQVLDLSQEIVPVKWGEKPHGDTYPIPNVWIGVSVENQKWADIRIPALLDTPAAVRFLSCEPLLGPVDLSSWLGTERMCSGVDLPAGSVPPRGHTVDCCTPCPLDWVIAGGESGPQARLMRPKWPRSLRDQCVRAGVPFLFKQWGEWVPTGQVGIGAIDPRERLVGVPDERGFREVMRRVGKHRAGRVLDGQTWDEFPEPDPGSVRIGGGG